MTNLNVRNYNEKRDFIRMKVDTEITIAVDGTDEAHKAYCRDLSGTGMLIEVDEQIAEGTICDTRLPSQNDSFPALDAKIKVVRCMPSANEEEKYELGTEIIEIGV